MEPSTFTDIFIKKPVLATVLSLVILLLGIKAFVQLPIRQFPMLDTNVINVSTVYNGAGPDLIESFVTSPLENALSGISGIDYLKSESTQGSSNIFIHFKLGYDINRANTDVSNAVSSVRYQLPKNINDPIISKEDPNANPIIYMSFSDPSLSEEEIGDYLNRNIKPKLSNLPDVGNAMVWSNQYAMRLWLDPQRMAAKNVSATDIANALRINNVQGALGQLEAKYQEFNVIGNTDLKTPQQFNQMVIKVVNGQLIRFQDVGYAELGAESYRNSGFVDGVRTSVISVTPTTTGNPLVVSKAINKIFPEIIHHLPPGMSAKMLWNSAKFISASLHEVIETLAIAIVCVLIVIFIFLGNWRSVMIPVVTVPLSIFGVSAVMLALGYSLNTLTFLAWVLAIGLVVDDAIVVLENIYRHIETGKSPFDAAIIGTREIVFAIIAMTLTLASVFAPIGFISGMTGDLFREFAFTLAAAVLISGFIALTLSPMMCSKVLAVPQTNDTFSHKVDHFFKELRERYHRVLFFVISHAKIVVIVAIAIYLSSWLLFKTLSHDLAPNEDQGVILTIVKSPTSANLAYTEKYSQQLVPIYSSIPEREAFGIFNGWPNGVNSAFSFLVLKPWDERKRSVDQIIAELMPKTWGIPGVMAFPFNPPPLPNESNSSIEFILKSTSSWEALEKAMDQLKALAQKNPGIVNIDTNLQTDQLQLQINIDRDKANSLGINMQDLGTAMNIMLGQPITGYFDRLGKSYEVIPQVYDKDRENPDQLSIFPISTLTNQIVPLGNIATFKQSAMPQSYPHFQQMRAITLSASTVPGYALGDALAYLQNMTAKYLPPNIQVDYANQSRDFMESQNAMAQTFIFALIFIFLVLAAQFESFRNPFIVMLSVPLSMFGALALMHLTHCTLNIFTEIGLVTLIGLISKHGILIVDFTEQLRDEGKDKLNAILDAAALRLRPILMTTGAMVLGALPLILASGAGSEARRQLGWVIVAGMGIGTCFTLFIVPTMYYLIAHNDSKKKR